MKKEAFVSAAVALIAVLSLQAFAAVPDIGASGCVTYSQARAMSPSLASKTDSELRSMGFCAGSGTSQPEPTQAAQTDYEPYGSYEAVSSGGSLAGMTLEQLFDIETRSDEETSAEINRISEEFADDWEFSEKIWDVYIAKGDEALANYQNIIGPEIDDLTQRSIGCRSQCTKSYSGTSEFDAWDRCTESCDSRYNEEYLAAIRKDVEFSIQKNNDALAEIRRMAAEKSGSSPLESFDEDDVIEAEQRRVKDETKAAIALVKQERTDETVGAAISAAEKNNVAAVLSQKSGSIGITKEGKETEFAKDDEAISLGDVITTGKKSALKTTLAEGSEVYVGENSEVKFGNPFAEGIELILGKIKIFAERQKAQKFIRIKSYSVAISVRATEFVVEYNNTEGTTSVYLHNGTVEVESSSGKTILEAGNVMIIGKGGEPVISSLDENSWISMGNEFEVGPAINRVFAWVSLCVAAAFLVMSLVLVQREKACPKKQKSQKNLSIRSLLLGIAGIITSPLPIIGFPASIAGAAFGRIQRMRKKTAISLIGIILSSIGLVISSIVLMAYFLS